MQKKKSYGGVKKIPVLYSAYRFKRAGFILNTFLNVL